MGERGTRQDRKASLVELRNKKMLRASSEMGKIVLPTSASVLESYL